MFDLAWSEIALIGVVALVVIGPKDLPEAIRGVAKGVQKLRRMAAEFQSHADELVREAKLDEVRNQINEVKSAVNEIRNFDLKGEIEKSVDADGSIRKTFEDDPLKRPVDAGATEPAATTPGVPPPEMMEGAMAGTAPELPPTTPLAEGEVRAEAAGPVAEAPPSGPATLPEAASSPEPAKLAEAPSPPTPAAPEPAPAHPKV